MRDSYRLRQASSGATEAPRNRPTKRASQPPDDSTCRVRRASVLARQKTPFNRRGRRGTQRRIINRKHVIPAEAGIINHRPSSLLASPTTILPSHFSVPPANMGTRAVQGRTRYARARRQSRIPITSRALATFSGGGSWAEPLWQTAHRRIPTEGVLMGGFASRIPASAACARSLLVPGTCDLTHRRTDASDAAAHCGWTGLDIPAP